MVKLKLNYLVRVYMKYVCRYIKFIISSTMYTDLSCQILRIQVSFTKRVFCKFSDFSREQLRIEKDWTTSFAPRRRQCRRWVVADSRCTGLCGQALAPNEDRPLFSRGKKLPIELDWLWLEYEEFIMSELDGCCCCCWWWEDDVDEVSWRESGADEWRRSRSEGWDFWRCCSLISFTARNSFFNFIRRFWNHILIWRSVKQSAWAISMRRLLVR